MLLMLATGATALHLPTTTINGRQYYYFKSKEKITVYGLSKRLGLTRQEIVEHNPSAVDGIKLRVVRGMPCPRQKIVAA